MVYSYPFHSKGFSGARLARSRVNEFFKEQSRSGTLGAWSKGTQILRLTPLVTQSRSERDRTQDTLGCDKEEEGSAGNRG